MLRLRAAGTGEPPFGGARLRGDEVEMAPERGLRTVVPFLLVCGWSLAAQPCAALETPSSPAATQAPALRNPRWAQPIELPGVENLHRVSATLYRGAQPTKQGLDELRRLGVKTVVSLRAFHGERAMVAAAGLGYERVSFKFWHPEDEDLRRFLAIASDPARQPVFVHCQRGADRTGTATAVYRVCVEGWSREDAIDEMVNGGYAFEPRFVQLKKYLRGFDPKALLPAAP
jgi:protein tyrosine phosphatase (PTP) superfamily phosphohydrolase (DUF442 family)